MIRDAMQNGSTQEEIAKAFTDALAKSVPQVKGNTKSDEDSIMEFLKHLK